MYISVDGDLYIYKKVGLLYKTFSVIIYDSFCTVNGHCFYCDRIGGNTL